MKNKKSLIALFLAVCLVFALAACNGNGPAVDVMQVDLVVPEAPVAPAPLPEVVVVEVMEDVEEEEEIYVATPVVQLTVRPVAPQVPVQPAPPAQEEPECDTYDDDCDHGYDEAVTLPCVVPDEPYDCEYGYCDCNEAEEPGYKCEEADEENGDDYYNNGDDGDYEEAVTLPCVVEPEEPEVPEVPSGGNDAPAAEVPDAPATEEE